MARLKLTETEDQMSAGKLVGLLAEVRRELVACQAELAKAHQLVGWLENERDEYKNKLARYAEAEKGVPEEPKFVSQMRQWPDNELYQSATAVEYINKLRDHSIALGARVKELEDTHDNTVRHGLAWKDKFEKAEAIVKGLEAERDAVVLDGISWKGRALSSESERDAAITSAKRWKVQHDNAMQMFDDAVRDAERYQKLRTHCRVTVEARNGYPEHAALVYYYGLKTPNDMTTYTAEGLDAAVDRLPAIKAEGGGHETD